MLTFYAKNVEEPTATIKPANLSLGSYEFVSYYQNIPSKLQLIPWFRTIFRQNSLVSKKTIFPTPHQEDLCFHTYNRLMEQKEEVVLFVVSLFISG